VNVLIVGSAWRWVGMGLDFWTSEGVGSVFDYEMHISSFSS